MQGQGNRVADTLPQDISSSVFSNKMHGRASHFRVKQPACAGSQSPSTDPAASLITLLSAAPVDLCRVSEEMRAQPDLQAIVVRLACYLSFSPDTSGVTIEESVIVVGTDRLRVLVCLWSLLRQRRGANPCDSMGSKLASANPSKTLSRGRAASRTEMAYLASFLASLGLDTGVPSQRRTPLVPAGPQQAEFFELTDMLVRDLVSFIPLIEPAFGKRAQNGRRSRARLDPEAI